MPEKETIERAREDKREGKSPTTQAGEFVREEIHHVREGKHGARSTKQAIAIGLSKARRAGVDLPPPEKGKTSERTRNYHWMQALGRLKPGVTIEQARAQMDAIGARIATDYPDSNKGWDSRGTGIRRFLHDKSYGADGGGTRRFVACSNAKASSRRRGSLHGIPVKLTP